MKGNKMEQFNKEKLCVIVDMTERKFGEDENYGQDYLVKLEESILRRFGTKYESVAYCEGFIAAAGKFGTMRGGSDEWSNEILPWRRRFLPRSLSMSSL
jgi:hypothetical protein